MVLKGIGVSTGVARAGRARQDADPRAARERRGRALRRARTAGAAARRRAGHRARRPLVACVHPGARAGLARTIRESDTLPSPASMLSGFDADQHGLFWNSFKRGRGYIHVPTIFSIARAHGLSTAMFIGKPKLRHIALPGSVDHLER